jgi:hypothetical protein
MRPSKKQERRKLQRRKLSYYMLVRDANTQKAIGNLLDVTPAGLLMDSRDPLPLEKDYRLRLDTTPEVVDKSYIAFIARTKWCHRDPTDILLYDIGFSIVTIGAQEAAILKRISEKYAVQDKLDISKL